MPRCPGRGGPPGSPPEFLINAPLVGQSSLELGEIFFIPRGVARKAPLSFLDAHGVPQYVEDRRVDALPPHAAQAIESPRDFVRNPSYSKLFCHAGMIALMCLRAAQQAGGEPIPCRPTAVSGRNALFHPLTIPCGGIAGVEACLFLYEVEHFANGLSDPGHESRWNPCHWAPNEASIIDRSELVDQEVGVLPQATGGSHANPERLGVLHQGRSERNDQGGRVVCVQKRLGLDDKDWPGFARLRPSPRIQVRQPNLAPLRHSDNVRRRRTPR